MPWLVVGGVLAAYFLLTHSSQAPASTSQIITGSAGTTGNTSVPLSAASKAPTGGVVGGALSTINGLSAAGCAAIASSKGVPSSLASTGCKAYEYLTPMGQAQLAYKYGAPALTYVGTKVEQGAVAAGKAVVGAAETVGNTVANAAKSTYHEIASWF